MSPLRSRNAQPLRYYLYISDTKLEMLFEQIDQSVRKRISAEFKIDLKIASLTLRRADNPGPTRVAKLRIVERFIDAHHDVGTIEEPGREYFRGQMNMQWGDMAVPAVCFRGTDAQGSEGVLLVGSKYHVIGEIPPLVVPPYSGYPYIAKLLMDLANRSENADENIAESTVFDRASILRRAWEALSAQQGPPGKDAFYKFPIQWLDFLAVPLAESASGDEDRVHIVLGTPLYVAMAR